MTKVVGWDQRRFAALAHHNQNKSESTQTKMVSDGNLYGLSLADGKELWKYNIGKPINARIAIGEGVLVVSSASRDGRLFCFGKK
ncbi:MAG: PQQ-binding-like beta-propeller repeat protein [Planctomycetota bacterium]